MNSATPLDLRCPVLSTCGCLASIGSIAAARSIPWPKNCSWRRRGRALCSRTRRTTSKSTQLLRQRRGQASRVRHGVGRDDAGGTRPVLGGSVRSCSDVRGSSAIIYARMDWRHMAEMLAAGDSAKFELLNLCVWVKTNGGMGSLHRSRHELVFVFRNGGEAHCNTVQLGRFGRNRTNVWNYPGANLFKRSGRKIELDLHPMVRRCERKR
jgi:hypothetical protein